MIPISEANFVVIDVETTGSDPVRNRITDIGCILVRDFKIVNTFSSLVKTRQHIPWYIQKMTGITNDMVAQAPAAPDVFESIRNMLAAENTFFVAHNSVFDWTFVNESIKRNGLHFDIVPHVCTLKLARKILPASMKKNVGAIAEFFDIPIQNRHRAFDDANATALFFIELLYILRERYGINYIEELLEFQNMKAKTARKLHETIIAKLLKFKQMIPAQCGLLIFIGQNGNVLQLYRANNMKMHIDILIEQANNAVKNVRSTLQQFHRLEWTQTNNELETYILEYRKTMQLSPLYNTYKKIDIYNAGDIIINDNELTKDMSMVAIMPNSEREKTIDVYCIKQAQYCACVTVGWKAELDSLFDTIQNTFFNIDDNDKTTKAVSIYADEIDIIKQWLIKYQPILTKINAENKDITTLWTEIENVIRSFYVN